MIATADRKRLVVVQMNKLIVHCTGGNNWSYIYNEKIKLVENQLGSSV